MPISILLLSLLFIAGCSHNPADTSRTEQSAQSVIEEPTQDQPGATEDTEAMVLVNSDGSVSVEVGASVMDTSDTEEIKVFEFTGKNFAFMMDGNEGPELRVNQGDRVRIEFTSESGFHDWVVDAFEAKTEKVQTGGKTAVEFVADKKGSFEYYCSVGSHREMGMKGNLIVE